MSAKLRFGNLARSHGPSVGKQSFQDTCVPNQEIGNEGKFPPAKHLPLCRQCECVKKRLAGAHNILMSCANHFATSPALGFKMAL